MVAHETHYLKLDPSMPNPYGTAIWLPRIEAATPFRNKGEAQAVKDQFKEASGVIEGTDGYFYVMKVAR